MDKVTQSGRSHDDVPQHPVEAPVADVQGAAISRRELLRRGLLIGGSTSATASMLFALGCRGPATATPTPDQAATLTATATTTPSTGATATVTSAPGQAGTPTDVASPAASPTGATIAVVEGTPAGAASPAGAPTRIAAPSATPSAAIDPLMVRAVYLTPDAIIDDATFNALLALADRTEINAMVIDIKDETGWLYHDSSVALARELGAVHPRYDLRQRLATLKAHHVYTIARIVCMQDPTLATGRPALAVRNSKTGGIWKNDNGVGWVNAMRPEVWDYNTAVAVEAARFGFDEIQYDYVRFPSDGDMAAIDVGAESSVTTRTAAIVQCLRTTREALALHGVPLAADIFGIVLVLADDNNIGQQLEALAPAVDYLCPMIYPSHFPPNGLGWRVPNDHPYEVILESLQLGGERIDDANRKFRPWLQDFSYGRGKEYGPDEVRAQIQATYDFGATGWMLWNANNTFTEGALLPEGR